MHKINYHTDSLRGPSLRKAPDEKEIILLRKYIYPKRYFHFFKRAFDIFFSVAFIIGILSWLTPIAGLLILLDSRGPVFFVQLRVGRNGRLFRCFKFRTMIPNEEANEKQAEQNDKRITKLGKFLRKTNIDELPQFVNILAGDMSVIGPRPHMLTDCTRFSFVIPAYKFRTLARPGISGLAQIKGNHGPTLNYESIFMRYHWDAEYIRNANFWLDLRIIFQTFLYATSNVAQLVSSAILRRSTRVE